MPNNDAVLDTLARLAGSPASLRLINGPEHLCAIAEFCADLLGLEYFRLNIDFAKTLDDCSECTLYSDGSFQMEIELALNMEQLVKVIGHEMVHLRQYQNNELTMHDNVIIWHDKSYPVPEFMSDEYFMCPWEMEARAYEAFFWYKWETRE